eukprot:scaffold30350_cov105-Isochrysis_galbana.AAC.2
MPDAPSAQLRAGCSAPTPPAASSDGAAALWRAGRDPPARPAQLSASDTPRAPRARLRGLPTLACAMRTRARGCRTSACARRVSRATAAER